MCKSSNEPFRIDTEDSIVITIIPKNIAYINGNYYIQFSISILIVTHSIISKYHNSQSDIHIDNTNQTK